jgi:hypothetical protein
MFHQSGETIPASWWNVNPSASVATNSICASGASVEAWSKPASSDQT